MDSVNRLEEYAMALARERAAWNAVRGHLPGTVGFDQERWQCWRSAMDEADRAAAKARTTIKIVQPSKAASRSPLFARAWPSAVRLPRILGGSERVG
jgi:hypothetical protein